MTTQLRKKIIPLFLLDSQRADYVYPEIMRENFERDVVQGYLSLPIREILRNRS